LLADEVTRNVVRAFREAGVEVVLLRGPSIARYLCGAAEERKYTDADLLVSPASFEGQVGFSSSRDSSRSARSCRMTGPPGRAPICARKTAET
jgi:hypothetical protein